MQFFLFKRTSILKARAPGAFQTFYEICGVSEKRCFELKVPRLAFGYGIGCLPELVSLGKLQDASGAAVRAKAITGKKFLCTLLYVVRALRFLKFGDLLDSLVSILSLKPVRLRIQIERRTEIVRLPLSLELTDSSSEALMSISIPELVTTQTSTRELGVREKLCYFCHYDAKDRLDDYVLHYLSALYEIGYEIVFISTCKVLPESDMERLGVLCSTILLRKNLGHDFISWSVAVRLFPPQSVHKKVLFANDSVFGPMTDLRKVEEAAEQDEAELYAIHDSMEVVYHLQSNFLLCGEKLFKTEAFKLFWNSVRIEFDKFKVITNYEIGISRFFLERGFNLGAYCPYNQLLPYFDRSSMNLKAMDYLAGKRQFIANPSHLFWEPAISVFNSPFIKKELIFKNPMALRNLYLWPKAVRSKSPEVERLIYNYIKKASG